MQWHLYEVIHESSGESAACTPVPIASWPSYKWQNPRIVRALYSLSHVISMRRIVYMVLKYSRSSVLFVSAVAAGSSPRWAV